jgi:hypothetical protein
VCRRMSDGLPSPQHLCREQVADPSILIRFEMQSPSLMQQGQLWTAQKRPFSTLSKTHCAKPMTRVHPWLSQNAVSPTLISSQPPAEEERHLCISRQREFDFSEWFMHLSDGLPFLTATHREGGFLPCSHSSSLSDSLFWVQCSEATMRVWSKCSEGFAMPPLSLSPLESEVAVLIASKDSFTASGAFVTVCVLTQPPNISSSDRAVTTAFSTSDCVNEMKSPRSLRSAVF